MSRIAFIFIISFFPIYHAAQINFPRISPDCELKQRIGLTDVTIQYSRPGMRGRKIFGELVPYGRIWRVGANESTKFTVDDDVEIAANYLKSGTYSLYIFPYKQEWEIVFHTNISHWGDGRDKYNPAEDAFRFRVKPEKLKETYETLTIEFGNFTHQSADLIIGWERTRVRFPIKVNTHAKVMADIEKQIRNNPTADTYYQAARYLQEKEKDYPQALNWLNKALEIGGDTYYFHRVKSLVEAALGDYHAAIQSAETSLELAAQQNKDEFVRENQRNIKSWKTKLKKNNDNNP